MFSRSHSSQFKEISKAHEILTDDEKRAMYDRYGEEGVSGGGPPGGGAADLFEMMMGGGRRRGASRGPQKRRGEDVVYPLKVSLADLYNGATKKLRLTKSVICKACSGYVCSFERFEWPRGCSANDRRC